MTHAQNEPADANENAVDEQNQAFVKHLATWPYWPRELHQAGPVLTKALGISSP